MINTADLFSVTTLDRRNTDEGQEPAVHAAAIGPGLLCGANRPIRDAAGAAATWPTLDTLQWWNGTEQVDCYECRIQIEGLRLAEAAAA